MRSDLFFNSLKRGFVEVHFMKLNRVELQLSTNCAGVIILS